VTTHIGASRRKVASCPIKSVDIQIVVVGWKPKYRLSQQPIELVFDHAVTFAHSLFEFLAVQDRDAAADVSDRSGILQSTGSNGNAFAANAQHVGNQLLGHDQLIGLHTVVT